MNDKDKLKSFIEENLFIINKKLVKVPFKLNKVQDHFLKQMTGRDLILKARQEGFSSLILAIFTFDFLFKPNSRQVVVSHEAKATRKLLDKVKQYIELLNLPLKYNSRDEMYNEQMNSTFYIGTAKASETGRGDTIHNLHLSEAAFYDKADDLVKGLLQAVPKNGRVFVESTANGMGNWYHREWGKGVNGNSSFTPHFYSWSQDEDYRLPLIGKFQPTSEEQELMVDYGLDKEQIAWRREKIKEFKNIDEFNQEYPINPELAFISSGNPVFDMKMLSKMLKTAKEPILIGNLVGTRTRMTVEETKRGYLKVWELPSEVDTYVIGIDVADGGNDYSVATVIKRRNFEMVAQFHAKISTDSFAKECERLGYFYNTAIMGVERNGVGIATLAELNRLYYPMLYYREDINDTGENTTTKLGWETNIRTRPIMINDLGVSIRSYDLIIHDENTIKELMTFVKTEKKKDGEAQEGCWDDRVMSLAIAVQMYRRTTSPNKPSKTNYTLESYGSSEYNNDYSRNGDPFANY